MTLLRRNKNWPKIHVHHNRRYFDSTAGVDTSKSKDQQLNIINIEIQITMWCLDPTLRTCEFLLTIGGTLAKLNRQYHQ